MEDIKVASSDSAYHSVLITGVSSGIGAALARHYLSRGYIVCGISRSEPKYLIISKNFIFKSCDLTDFNQVPAAIEFLVDAIKNTKFETLFLNAGTFGPSPQRGIEVSMEAFLGVFHLNFCGVKATLDACLKSSKLPKNIIMSGSISGIRPRSGMLSYCVSKSALNTLTAIYQLENPEIYFLSLGLCNVDAKLSDTILGGSAGFPELAALNERSKSPGYLVSPDERAVHIASIISSMETLNLTKGNFYEIRDLLNTHPELNNTL